MTTCRVRAAAAPLALALAAVMAAMTVAALAAAPAAALDAAQAGQVVARMQADPAWARIYATCPVDLPRRRAPRLFAGERPTEASCAAAPLGCFAACEAGAGAHCFALGRAFQEAKTTPGRVWEQLFAAACAGGAMAGCTNRAAGARNGGYDDDPIGRSARARRQSCERRSFMRACAGGDSWGCAMLGQAHRRGEGGAASAARARAAYRRACSLAPGSEPCAFAQDDLGRMGGGRSRR